MVFSIYFMKRKIRKGEKPMKKFFAFALAMILAAGVSACAGKPEATTQRTSSVSTKATQTTAETSATSESNNETTSSESSASVTELPAVAPADEVRVQRTFSVSEAPNGITLEVTVYGYSSETLGKDFYVKSNEFFRADVKVTNTSEKSFWQFLPTACRENGRANHNHEIAFSLSDGKGHALHSTDSFGKECPEMIDIWEIKAGESYEWRVTVAAGENTYGEGKGDLTVSDYPWLGIALYDRSIYENDMLDFSGNFSFSYSAKSETFSNELTVKLPVSLTVVYITK